MGSSILPVLKLIFKALCNVLISSKKHFFKGRQFNQNPHFGQCASHKTLEETLFLSICFRRAILSVWQERRLKQPIKAKLPSLKENSESKPHGNYNRALSTLVLSNGTVKIYQTSTDRKIDKWLLETLFFLSTQALTWECNPDVNSFLYQYLLLPLSKTSVKWKERLAETILTPITTNDYRMCPISKFSKCPVLQKKH